MSVENIVADLAAQMKQVAGEATENVKTLTRFGEVINEAMVDCAAKGIEPNLILAALISFVGLSLKHNAINDEAKLPLCLWAGKLMFEAALGDNK